MVDIDILGDLKCLQRMLENLETLKRLGYEFSILQQNRNLEDELARACNCNLRSLLTYTDSSSSDELKGKFIKNPSCVLKHPNFDHKKLWSTELIPHFKQYQANQLKGKDISLIKTKR